MPPAEPKKDDRVYLRINSDLKVQIQAYCDRRGLDLSDLTTRFFTKLVELEKRKKR